MSNLMLNRINIKEEDLTSTQINIATELNKYIGEVERLIKDSLAQTNPVSVSDNIIKISGYFQRVGGFISDLDYEVTKIEDRMELAYLNAWNGFHKDSTLNTTSMGKKAELSAYTEGVKKELRIAKWIFEKAKILYGSLEKVINSTNRKFGALISERQSSGGQHEI